LNKMKEERFRKMFSAFGTLTDCGLKFTKDGKFRKFGFVGFKCEEDAEKALKHFNKSFVDTSRVTVEFCTDLGDPNKSRPWSKHSRQAEKPKVSKCCRVERLRSVRSCLFHIPQLEEDPGFQEFLAVHKKRTQVPTWANDSVEKKEKNSVGDDYLNFDSDESEEMSDNENDEDASEEEDDNQGVPLFFTFYEFILFYFSSQIEPTTDFTIKLRGAPFNVKEQQVREFMMPLKPVAIRFTKNEDGRSSGYVYVDLQSEAEVERALRLNRDYMGGRYIEVFRVTNFKDKRGKKETLQEKKFVSDLKEDEEEEDVAESGRLFVRNLPYTCTEEELKELFTKHGPLSELHFPIDSLTKKPKGFAFVTFMIPENAVTALAQLDGHIFQGRILHVIPSRIKKENPEQGPNAPGSSSYKRQKDAKDKAASSSSHNWNTLFLGTSAVADAIAEKYNTTKSQVLDHESQGSLAVRMALGETQIVQETRQFLLDNGISLDSFSQAAGQHSNSVMLVKNLPSGVQVEDLEALFSPHGSLGRVLLPPAGLTAIVEFLEPTEAKRAFTRLAYTKFQHVPLYLEWAPVAVFSTPKARKPGEMTQTDKQKQEEEEEEKEEEDEEESLPGSTLFIKNLNFSTTEETLQEVGSQFIGKAGTLITIKSLLPGKLLSMGYGFVQYKKPEAAQKAMRQLQHCMVDEHQLELKISERGLKSGVATTSRKKQKAKKQTTSKILVRNVPFQATVKELRELFCTFGELKTVRLPKKGVGGAHRGFAFVDFITKQDAKKAFMALCHSTHLYGRRLVLEWAETEESVEDLRRKTAQHFHDFLIFKSENLSLSKLFIT
uniref:RRM domain-containing protein n=1 Tax=Pygocentrus nattereri TaxID=42514 RepID=A0AAR2JXL9_PYGNA